MKLDKFSVNSDAKRYVCQMYITLNAKSIDHARIYQGQEESLCAISHMLLTVSDLATEKPNADIWTLFFQIYLNTEENEVLTTLYNNQTVVCFAKLVLSQKRS